MDSMDEFDQMHGLEDVEKNDIMSFAGAWSMSDSDTDKIKKNLREMWKKKVNQ